VSALISSDAYATGIAALAVDDARRALEWPISFTPWT